MKHIKLILILNILFTISSCKKVMEEDSKDCTVDFSNSLFCTTKNKASTVNGFTINYFPNSTKKESEGNYTNGIRDGFWKFYNLNGNLKYEGNYANQKQNGFCKEYFEDSALKEEGNLDNCVRNGFYKYYHQNAKDKVESEGHYINGIKSGVWKYYDDKGNNTKNIDYKC